MTGPTLSFDELKTLAAAEAQANYKLDLALILAIVAQETNGNPWATRYEPDYKYLQHPEIWAKKTGVSFGTEVIHQQTSWGLMQVMGGLARQLGYPGAFPRLCEPEIGLHFGCVYLSQLMARGYKTLDEVIASYNAGSPQRDNTGKFVNQVYVDGVRSHLKQFTA